MSKSRTANRHAMSMTCLRKSFLSSDGLDPGTAAQSRGNGGAGRDRTDDLKLAKLALSQLSYGPDPLPIRTALQRKMVGLGRLELPTSRLSSARSNQLSYRPELGCLRSNYAAALSTAAQARSITTKGIRRRRPAERAPNGPEPEWTF